MLRYVDGEESGDSLPALGVAERRGLPGRLVMPVTRWLRAVSAERYIGAGERFDFAGHHGFIFGLNQAFCLTARE